MYYIQYLHYSYNFVITYIPKRHFFFRIKNQKQIKHGLLNVYLHNNQMIWNDDLRMVYTI